MVKRICLKCNAVFDRKFNYVRHINKVFDCSTNNEINENSNNENSSLIPLCQIVPNCAETVPNYAETVPNYAETSTDNKIEQNNDRNNEINDEIGVDIGNENYYCYYCKKNFSSKSTLTRHQKANCKVKKDNDERKENIFKLLLEKDKENKDKISQLEEQNKLFEKQNKLLMDKIDKLINIKETSKLSKSTKSSKITNNNQRITNTSNTMNNNQKITNNTLNNNNNIVMVNFGKEDLSIIDERQFIDKVIKKPNVSGVKIPDEVLKIIHFNPQYPQLSNIYISDINREKCMVYEDGEWKLSNVNNIPQIMDKVCVFSAEQISNLRTKQPNNKPLNDRLDVIEKYNNMIDGDYVDDLRDEGRQVELSRCEEFQAHTYNTLKKTLYNEGKKLKKTIKIK